jgi:carbon-monoxide dehydrogenase medium subunit
MSAIADTSHRVELLRPTSVEEAVELLSTHEGAIPLGGGTAVQMLRRRHPLRPPVLVDLRGIPRLSGLELDGLTLVAGALVTHRRMETDPVVRAHAPLLPQVYGTIANVRVRNSATIGGNLAHADHRLDPPGALGLLGAEVELASPSGRRRVPVAGFQVDYETTVLARDEILLGIRIPRTPATLRCDYLKFRSLGRNDWPCAGVAAAIDTADGGRVVRLAVTAATKMPLQLRIDAAGMQRDELLAAVGALVAERVEPVANLRGDVDFKRRIAKVTATDVVRRLLDAEREEEEAR